jgi:hypothetical protein
MELVQILARELSEWPEQCEAAAQDQDGWVGSYTADVCYSGFSWMGRDYFGAFLDIGFHEELATDHATAIVTREMWEAERAKLVFTDISDDFNPIINRDRIRAIDVQLADLTAERAERIAELAAEGFALLDAVGPAGDMSDWRNWEAGDMIECVSHNKQWSEKFEIGSISVIKRIDQGHHLSMFIGYHVNPLDFKFHSRPKP